MNIIKLVRFKSMFHIQLCEFRRDLGTVFLSFIFPLLFVIGLVVTNQSNPTFKFKFGIVNEFNNAYAQEFVQALTATRSMDARTIGRSEVQDAIKNGEIYAAVVIPSGDFLQGNKPIELIVGPRYEEFSRIVLDAVRVRLERQSSDQAATGMHVEVTNPDVETRSELTFVFPGILAMALLQLGLFATAVPLLQARDRGTLRYLLLTPISAGDLLASQLVLRFLIAIAQLTLLLGIGMVMLELKTTDWAMVLGVACLGILLLVSIGYAIAGMAPDLSTGMSVVMVVNFTMLFGGNIFWDANTSNVLYYIALVVPLSYLADMFRQVITGVSGLWPLWLDALMILAWSAAAMLIAVKTFRFDTISSNGRKMVRG